MIAMPTDPMERPTLADLSGDGDNGLHCPVCHCRDFRVIYTRPKENKIMRLRECRHCGRRVPTFERIA